MDNEDNTELCKTAGSVSIISLINTIENSENESNRIAAAKILLGLDCVQKTLRMPAGTPDENLKEFLNELCEN